jgi:hypothetical protein
LELSSRDNGNVAEWHYRYTARPALLAISCKMEVECTEGRLGLTAAAGSPFTLGIFEEDGPMEFIAILDERLYWFIVREAFHLLQRQNTVAFTAENAFRHC